jgi:hypothetical protein
MTGIRGWAYGSACWQPRTCRAARSPRSKAPIRPRKVCRNLRVPPP